MSDYKHLFPIFENHKSIIYLDSASTTQKPSCVFDAEKDYYSTCCASYGRGSYDWANKTTKIIDRARENVAQFLGCHSDEVTFTSGATMSLNLVALLWGEANLKDGDEVLYCPQDHDSLNLPWFLLQEKLAARGVRFDLKPYRLTSSGLIDACSILQQVTPRVRLINLTHVHNVAGVVNHIRDLCAHLPETLRINLDCSQSVSSIYLKEAANEADFVSFSGHKMYAANGIGVLSVKRDVQPELTKLFSGGGQFHRSDGGGGLSAFVECGTLNTGGIVSLEAALGFITTIGVQKIYEHKKSISELFMKRVKSMPAIQLLFPESLASRSVCDPIAFNVQGYSSTEIGDYLASVGIFVRHGNHCSGGRDAESSRSNDSVRISFGLYNTESDVENLLEALEALPNKEEELTYHFGT